MNRFIQKARLVYKNIETKTRPAWNYVRRHSLVLLAILGLLLVAGLVAAQFLPKPQETVQETPPAPRVVKAVRFGSGFVSEQAVGTVKNLSSITLVAQSAGPVHKIDVMEGDFIEKGGFILNQTSAYGAGNAASVQRQIAGRNYELAKTTRQNTELVVAQNRILADQNRDDTEQLRRINEQSITETKSLLTTTEQVIAKLEADIAAASDPNVIQGLRQQLITYKGVYNSNQSALRSTEYSTNTNNPPTKIADITRDLVYTTTELQLRSAKINQDIAFLNLKLAQINEAATRVVAPFAGSIEKLYVQPGQYVTPGTPVAKIKGETNLCLQIAVSGDVATRINDQQSLVFKVNDREFQVPITHVSSTPINGQLFEVLAVLPAEYHQFIPEDATVNVTLPIYQTTILEGNYFVQLEAVFVTNTGSYVLVAENGKAVRKQVVTGQIIGSSIEIKEGLAPEDVVILDRRVIEGEAVETQIQTTPNFSVQELG